MDIRFMNRLNPFYKAVTIVVAGVMLTFAYRLSLNLAVCAVCLVLLLVFARIRYSALVKFLVPVLIAAASLYTTGLLQSGSGQTDAELTASYSFTAGISLYNAARMSTRLLAYAMLGILFSLSTDAELFVQSMMHQCHLKPKFAYGILAAFHLMPHIRDEYHNARLAYLARGMKAGRLSLKPLFAAMVSCIRWSETVAMAMESKGFDGDGDRTYYHVTTAGIRDVVFFLAVVLGMLAGILLLHY